MIITEETSASPSGRHEQFRFINKLPQQPPLNNMIQKLRVKDEPRSNPPVAKLKTQLRAIKRLSINSFDSDDHLTDHCKTSSRSSQRIVKNDYRMNSYKEQRLSASKQKLQKFFERQRATVSSSEQNYGVARNCRTQARNFRKFSNPI